MSHCFRSMKCIPGGPRDKWTMRNCSRDPGGKFQWVVLGFCGVRVPRHARLKVVPRHCEVVVAAVVLLWTMVNELHLMYSKESVTEHIHFVVQLFGS